MEVKGGVDQEQGSEVGNVCNEVRATDVLYKCRRVIVRVQCELTKTAVEASDVRVGALRKGGGYEPHGEQAPWLLAVLPFRSGSAKWMKGKEIVLTTRCAGLADPARSSFLGPCSSDKRHEVRQRPVVHHPRRILGLRTDLTSECYAFFSRT